MPVSVAKVVGEISPGYVTIVLNPDVTGTEAVNNTESEIIATLPVDTVPPELREADLDIWFAVEKLPGKSSKHIRKVFPMTSEAIPQEYYSWLEENGISS